jgi:hypothetical protein
LQALAPPLIDTIKAAGLVVVSDTSGERQVPTSRVVSDKMDGALGGNGVLVFTDQVDITGF